MTIWRAETLFCLECMDDSLCMFYVLYCTTMRLNCDDEVEAVLLPVFVDDVDDAAWYGSDVVYVRCLHMLVVSCRSLICIFYDDGLKLWQTR